MLLVLFFHPRTLLSLPQCSHTSDTGSSRAPLKTARVGQHGVPAMHAWNVLWYTGHVTSFQYPGPGVIADLFRRAKVPTEQIR